MTIPEVVSLSGLTATTGLLVGCIWRVSAKMTRFETACDKLLDVEKIQSNHTTSIALHNTAIAVINTKLDTIIVNQKDTKDEFASFRKEWKANNGR